MLLNIAKLTGEGETPVSGEAAFDFADRDFAGCRMEAPVRMRYTAQAAHGLVTLDLCIEARYEGECARCLSAAQSDVTLERQYLLDAANLAEALAELPLASNGELDLGELCYQELVLETPLLLLCSETCSGLCPTCGRAKAQCRCEAAEEGDPRLAVLRQLLDDETDD